MTENKPLAGRLALITGASRGIGRAMAMELAKAGAHIIAVARTTGALEELDDAIRQETGENATLVPLDVTDGPGIDRLGGAIYERWGRLDIFFGNAGILGPLSPLGHIEPETWEKVINVNLNANWRFIRSLDPLLKRSDAARVVFVTSRAGHRCKAYWGGYAVTKAALECLARIYANECANTNIRVNLLNPGPIRTQMRAAAYPGEDPETLPTPEELAVASLPLFLPEMQENGATFDFIEGRLERSA
ncbi:SDR family NAD(P)-dependent oxidoreductase [Thermopetrobacter sp. TC1]|uniref:SDR family NAD(P)-dependent oxidoreductase n=1 Tax=Thermopetrobacter sp. TC1 TaxID=1495045 RepID=UPI00056F40E4|nr:SDR family NAD(P)-dependent oxidoreductase [Thermopetrobacter sp. TC1]